MQWYDIQRTPHNHLKVMCVFSAVCLLPVLADAGSPSTEQALRFTPSQKDVEIDRPAAADAPKCSMAAQKLKGQAGWPVKGAAGVPLRWFADTNRDNSVDQWSYYKDGLLVYRDIDSNFNGKVDQCRWFHTGGTRWGLDSTAL